jgi:RNA polymerase sigma factor (sigma-70 family)
VHKICVHRATGFYEHTAYIVYKVMVRAFTFIVVHHPDGVFFDWSHFSQKNNSAEHWSLMLHIDNPDVDLVRQCLAQKGHSFLAFRTLLERHESIVFNTAVRYVRNIEVAEEITQEAFLKAYNSLENLKDGTQFRSWLLRITKNQCVDQLREQKRLQFSNVHDAIEHTPPPQKDDNPVDDLVVALQQLSEDEQDVLSLHYFSELSVKDISEALNISESAVKMRLMRAREKLEKMMAK